MFENLQDRPRLHPQQPDRPRRAVGKGCVRKPLREVRRALLEADVALEVVRGFTDRVREKAVGAEIVKSIKPGQMVVKLVHDELVALLGEEGRADRFERRGPRRHHDGRPAGLGQDDDKPARSPHGSRSATARRS